MRGPSRAVKPVPRSQWNAAIARTPVIPGGRIRRRASRPIATCLPRSDAIRCGALGYPMVNRGADPSPSASIAKREFEPLALQGRSCQRLGNAMKQPPGPNQLFPHVAGHRVADARRLRWNRHHAMDQSLVGGRGDFRGRVGEYALAIEGQQSTAPSLA
jgi:hypothetical protein